MKIATYRRSDGSTRAGIVDGDKIFEIPTSIYPTVQSVIDAGDDSLSKLALIKLPSEPLASVVLLAPLPKPPRIFGIGLNYADHATESQMNVMSVPTVFLKLPSSVVGPGTDVVLPKNSSQPDYEAELGVVIGRSGYRIPADQWEAYVFGYTVVNDVSARDVQLSTSQWTLGKSFPTFTPIGPWIVTRDEVPDPHSLSISLSIDGEVLQDSNTRHLIFKIPQLIEYISSITPLEPGDIISTGTPAGVGLGRTPQRWLRSGEEMVITIDRIGELRNRTVAEGA
jgi:2-keto-4-pentenoate hydratase/2-oxohepta-3-ene-1,7-dioic acid hydratase in catechol pathway